MATKNQIKFVQSLHRKKYRQKYGQFVVEGEKSVGELINSDFEVIDVFARADWLDRQETSESGFSIYEASATDLERMSFFKTASSVVAVAKQKGAGAIDMSQKWTLVLDGINDPGNLGTIVRIADWYGIQQIICSANTVELYNPKTISSTMGSFTRVDLIYGELTELLKDEKRPLFYALMDGQALSQTSSVHGGVIVIGSEANGISPEVLSLPHTAITIPRIGSAESLNAGVATGIICDRLVGG